MVTKTTEQQVQTPAEQPVVPVNETAAASSSATANDLPIQDRAAQYVISFKTFTPRPMFVISYEIYEKKTYFAVVSFPNVRIYFLQCSRTDPSTYDAERKARTGGMHSESWHSFVGLFDYRKPS